jgi:pyruvate ferredoxin oxidoreductase gamma subunit
MADQSSVKLPFKDQWGFCNVLISALGGDGANMAAKMTFKLGCTALGLDGGYDAKYGSEKKGTATDVSVRFCEHGTPVRQAGPTTRPHLLVIFHDDLIRPLNLNRGVQADAIVIVNSTQTPEAIRDVLQLHSGTIICVDATKIAFDTNSRLNMPLMAVLLNELGFPRDRAIEAIKKQWPKAAESNVKAFEAAVGGGRRASFAADGKYPLMAPAESAHGAIGWKNMLNGGTIDGLKHSTFGRDNRIGGLGAVPVFHPEACTQCMVCLTVCSDPGGWLFRDGRLVGLDARYCKGCMRCVEVCPQTKKGKGLTIPIAGENAAVGQGESR